MRPIPFLLTLIVLFFGVDCVAAKPKSAGTSSGHGDPVLMETFEAAWGIIRDSHYDTNYNGVDWGAAREEFKPRAEEARNNEELREVLMEMLSRLGMSHVAVFPGDLSRTLKPRSRELGKPAGEGEGASKASKSAKPGTDGATADGAGQEEDAGEDGDGVPGFEVRFLEGKFVVLQVDPASPAAKAGIQAGWVLRKIGRSDLTLRVKVIPAKTPANQKPFFAWGMATALLRGQPGSKLRLEFVDNRNRVRAVEVERIAQTGDPVKLGDLPTLYARFEKRKLVVPGGGSAGYIHFNMWMVPIVRQFDQAVDDYRGADGMVIDLRGNIGGIAGMIMGVAGHFLNERISLGAMKMRGNQLQFFANPRRIGATGQRVVPFAGPVAILVDGVSLSAAEIFAGGMQDIGRARIFGETTPGQALPAIWDKLPNGDVLYHPFADFVTPSNIRLESRGVVPDVKAPLRRAALVRGADPALESALKWISAAKKTGVRNSKAALN